MALIVDLHCHLDLYADPRAIVKEAVDRGAYILSVTTTPSAFEGTAALASAHRRIRTGLGLHPEIAPARAHELGLFEKLLPRTEYVGEIGLDGSPDHRANLDLQSDILMEILLMCARAGGKVLSIHSREARGRVLDLIALEPFAGCPILHWFVGSSREVSRAADLGCWFSVGPAMMRSDRGRRAVAAMPRERLVPESDGPFATANGRPLNPWEAMDIVHDLSEIWEESPDSIQAQLSDNFQRLASWPDNKRFDV